MKDNKTKYNSEQERSKMERLKHWASITDPKDIWKAAQNMTLLEIFEVYNYTIKQEVCQWGNAEP